MKKIIILNLVYLLIIAGLVFYIFSSSQKIACAPCPKESQEATTTITPTVEKEEAKAEEITLFERNNIYGCSLTSQAAFNLGKKAHVNKIRSWFSWQQNETETPYRLTQDNQLVKEGTLKRKDCDPYQRQWCIAIDESFNQDLEVGDYVLEVPAGRVCQNSQSENKGFVFLFGYWQ